MWCINDIERVNSTVKGHFECPESLVEPILDHCCGLVGEQYCCNPLNTPGMRWGIAIGVTIFVLMIVAVGYSIQVFRACDLCYHECPICTSTEEDTEFLWDTRWYSVSHEGNRYGVTFHSKRFAKHFMQVLETRYGPWNTANILKIKREEHDFVVLNIFFHDLFTPWFYTQGPIKNDEEWIKSDFKDICYQVRDDLAVKICKCCVRGKKDHYARIAIKNIVSATTFISTDTSTGVKAEGSQKSKAKGARPSLKPWTKSTFRESFSRSPCNINTVATPSSSGGMTSSSRGVSAAPIILEAIVEEYGCHKATQTQLFIV